MPEMKIIKFEDLGLDKTGKYYISKFVMDNGRVIENKFPSAIKSKGMICAPIIRAIMDKAELMGRGVSEKECDKFIKY